MEPNEVCGASTDKGLNCRAFVEEVNENGVGRMEIAEVETCKMGCTVDES